MSLLYIMLTSPLHHIQIHQITQGLQQAKLTTTPEDTESETMDKETRMLDPGTLII